MDALDLEAADPRLLLPTYHNCATMFFLRRRRILALTLGCLSCVSRAAGDDHAPFDAVDLNAPAALDKVAAQLASKRVVFIGETHDRYDHHLNQLEVIRRLRELDPDIAIGVEYFPRTFQPQLDDYIAGRTTEDEFLRVSEYYKNWGYDYRLYASIFRFAREQRIPVRPLNVPPGLASEVAKAGIAGLSEKQRVSVPSQIEPADEAYRDRLRKAFEAHKDSKPDAFEHFVEAQLVWDEGMAETAAAYLNANPARRLVVLAGAGHVEFGSGIPKRLERRTKASFAILLSSGEQVEPHIADYLLLSKKQELPPAGSLGVSLEEKDGECRIRSLTVGGAAEKGGLKKGDVLVAINRQTVGSIADVRTVLWDKKPKDSVVVKIREKRRFEPATEREVEIELTAPPNTGKNRPSQ
ncbi:MAG TPA: ChaN family lipoprotein [Bryobacteraceae bacterium]|nr:ChaN family lipoprotein [Bryobacteraceae bacterium]